MGLLGSASEASPLRRPRNLAMNWSSSPKAFAAQGVSSSMKYMSGGRRVLISKLVLLLSLAWVLFLGLMACTYARPVSDDFAGASIRNWFEFVYNDMYCNWSGRWVSIGFEACLLPHIDLVRHYPYLILALGCLQVIGFAAYWKVLVGRVSAFTWGVVIFALVWCGIPDMGQGIYWFTGSIENQTPIGLSLILMSRLLDERELEPRSRVSWGTLGSAVNLTIAFLIPGIHEVSGFMLCISLGAMVALGVYSRHPAWRSWLLTFAFALAGFLVMYMAPGNAVRAVESGFSNRQSPEVAIALTTSQLIKYLGTWSTDPKSIALALCILFLPEFERNRLGRMRFLWAVPLLCFVLIVGSLAGASWSIGVEVPPRTIDTLYLVFLLGWIATLMGISSRYSVAIRFGRLSWLIQPSALLFLATTVVFTGNAPKVWRSLRVDAPEWYAAEARQDSLIAAAQRTSQSSITIPHVPKTPYFIFNEPIKMDEKSFPNNWIARYYGFRSIRMAKPELVTVACWNFAENQFHSGKWSFYVPSRRSPEEGIVVNVPRRVDYIVRGDLLELEVDGAEHVEAQLTVNKIDAEGVSTEVDELEVYLFYAPRGALESRPNWPFTRQGRIALKQMPGGTGRYRGDVHDQKGWTRVIDTVCLYVKTPNIFATEVDAGAHFQISVHSIQVLRDADSPLTRAQLEAHDETR